MVPYRYLLFVIPVPYRYGRLSNRIALSPRRPLVSICIWLISARRLTTTAVLLLFCARYPQTRRPNVPTCFVPLLRDSCSSAVASHPPTPVSPISLPPPLLLADRSTITFICSNHGRRREAEAIHHTTPEQIPPPLVPLLRHAHHSIDHPAAAIMLLPARFRIQLEQLLHVRGGHAHLSAGTAPYMSGAGNHSRSDVHLLLCHVANAVRWSQHCYCTSSSNRN
mmetsp:Transcript_26325/g.57066  ORF Transcript_26325/g.57066 Transcript_26325/m.57066 type:complete len:223 (+) Transcript_26325:2-670(+)